MKLTIGQDVLLKALLRVSNVVERRNTIPILSNILIEARDGHLHLTSTDLELEARDSAVALDMDRPGATTTAADTFLALVRKLSADQPVELDLVEERLVIEQAKVRYELPTLPSEDFQSMEDFDPATSFSLPADSLRFLIGKTSFAISTEEARYYLGGVYLHARDRDGEVVLCAVATDGHRLAMSEVELPKGSEALSGITIPRKTVREIDRLLGNSDDDVSVKISDSRAVFGIDGAILVTKLIEGGTFPDYDRVVPTNNERILELSLADFRASVERIFTLSAPLKLIASDNNLVIAGNSVDVGQGEEQIGVSYAGDKLEIGFNARYLLDIMGNMEGENMRIECSDPSAPALLSDPEERGARYVLMPLRV